MLRAANREVGAEVSEIASGAGECDGLAASILVEKRHHQPAYPRGRLCQAVELRVQYGIRRHVGLGCVEGRRHHDVVLDRPVASREWVVERSGHAQHEGVAERRVPIQTEHGSAREESATPDRGVNRQE